jgi:hypothetical protein
MPFETADCAGNSLYSPPMKFHPARYRGILRAGFVPVALGVQVINPPVARDCTVKKIQHSKLKLGVAPLVLSIALVSAPAFAQDAAEEGATDNSEIVVTGSLVRNPNLTTSSPVNVTSADEIQLRQSNVAEDILRDVPGVAANVGSSVNNGNGGASFVDLRGLGPNRNIVLLDSQRIVPANLNGNVDLNNIPLALVERVDVLTGGASTTYGADAVSGVVNFITKRDFAGVDLSVGQQLTERGDGNIFRADLTIGANFDDGRGNAVLSIGYQQADPVYFGGERPLSESDCRLVRWFGFGRFGHRFAVAFLDQQRWSAPDRCSRQPCSAVRSVQLQPVQHLPDAVRTLQHVHVGAL